jgi:hypothetical protein
LPLKHAIGLLKEAFENCQSEGWVGLRAALDYFKENHPALTAKAYGSAGPKKLILKCKVFDIEKGKDGKEAYRPKSSPATLRLVKP